MNGYFLKFYAFQFFGYEQWLTELPEAGYFKVKILSSLSSLLLLNNTINDAVDIYILIAALS